MKPKKQPTEIKYDRKAVYIGRRIGFDGKVYQAFLLLPERKEMNFQGVKGLYLGYTYECSASKISTRPKRTDDTHIDSPEWQGADAVVDAKNAEKREARKLSQSTKPALKAAIEALRPLCRDMRFSDHRRALIEYLVNQAFKLEQKKRR